MPVAAVAAGALRIGSMFAGKTAGTLSGAAKGVSRSGGMLRKVILKKTKVKRENIARDKVLNKRILEKRRRREKESLLEAFKTRGKSGLANIPGKSLLENALDFIAVLLIGWLVDKLPQIMKWIKDLITRIELLVDSLKRFVENLGKWLNSIGKLVVANLQNWIKLDFKDKSGKVDAAMKELQDAFKGMDNAFEDAKTAVGGDMGQIGGAVASGDLFEIIAGGEGGYESINRGYAGDSPGGAAKYFGKNLQDMSVGEVMKLQSQDKLFAVGKYQIIPDTMVGFVRTMGISKDDKFNAATQEKFKDYVINFKRPEVGRYIRGQSNNRAEAAQELAREFASVGLSYAEAGKTRGQSRYAGSAGNRASISPESIESALDRARQSQGGQGGGNGGPLLKHKGHKAAKFVMGGGRVLTSGMGMRGLALSPGMHMGVDVSGTTGEPLQAFTNGVIEGTGYEPNGYGYWVSWVDENGIGHLYGHMNKPAFVRKGQTVAKGTILGELGSTGRSTGPHLHWETATNPSDTGRSKAAVLTRFNPLSRYGIDAPFGGTIRPDPGLSSSPGAPNLGVSGGPQNTIIIIEEEAPSPMMVDGSGGSSIIVMGESLNSIIKKQLLTSLAYT